MQNFCINYLILNLRWIFYVSAPFISRYTNLCPGTHLWSFSWNSNTNTILNHVNLGLWWLQSVDNPNFDYQYQVFENGSVRVIWGVWWCPSECVLVWVCGVVTHCPESVGPGQGWGPGGSRESTTHGCPAWLTGQLPHTAQLGPHYTLPRQPLPLRITDALRSTYSTDREKNTWIIYSIFYEK